MRTTWVLAAAIVGAVCVPASAGATDYVATCDSLTVTAPAGSRTLVGQDASPAGLVPDGTTVSWPFFQMSSETTVTHWYTITVIDPVSGAQLDYVVGQVPNCPTIPFPVSETTDAPPIIPLAEVEPELEPQPVVVELPSFAEVWAHVALAPPW